MMMGKNIGVKIGSQWDDTSSGNQRCNGKYPMNGGFFMGKSSITGWWFGTFFYFSIYWECHHPNRLSYFSEG
jgi:hypothetical protein